jgi:hypothetical protein
MGFPYPVFGLFHPAIPEPAEATAALTRPSPRKDRAA